MTDTVTTIEATRERQLAHERDVAQAALGELRCHVEAALRVLGESPRLPRDPDLFVPYTDDVVKLRVYLRTALDATRGKP